MYVHEKNTHVHTKCVHNAKKCRFGLEYYKIL